MAVPPTSLSSAITSGKAVPKKASSSAAAGKVDKPVLDQRVMTGLSHQLSVWVLHPDNRAKSRPTADDFRSTGREGAVLDPALSAELDEGHACGDDEEDKGRVASSLLKNGRPHRQNNRQGVQEDWDEKYNICLPLGFYGHRCALSAKGDRSEAGLPLFSWLTTFLISFPGG
ncbi:hypothetical protein PGTUg99_002664 [Puccinia graminis f. sp. tritici]|uniref:Uncharacterized protein n=1 Tax=Puccinia graminis f. sp. tritici TaxID=56615 RepID=A0A5B0RDY3_PUCGR|nr:hypothetical protein PGTUg99_002664 [Puccinia graminis f. sp. tritici]